MSYGVIASKVCQVLVLSTGGDSTLDADVVLDRFQSIWGAGAWVPGRLTLTRVHLNFIPHRAGRGMAMLDLRLTDVKGVEAQGGRLGKVATIRTDAHLLNARMVGATSFGRQAAELVAAARRL